MLENMSWSNSLDFLKYLLAGNPLIFDPMQSEFGQVQNVKYWPQLQLTFWQSQASKNNVPWKTYFWDTLYEIWGFFE